MDGLKVGIIGANAERGWARESHVPAVRSLEGLELVAVANKGQEAADAAAAAFGVPKAYGDAAALIADSEIDLVTVATTLPTHHELVSQALAAGKHVYSEYPLGLGVAQSEELAAAAAKAGVHSAIGLQARGNKAVRRARELLDAGAIGRSLAVRVFSPTAGFGPKTAAAEAYTEDPGTGVNLVTVQTAHTLDLLIALLGGFDDLSAMLTTQFPLVQVGDGAPRRRRTSDHVLVQARLASGVAATVEVIGGRPPETPFVLEIEGTDGTLALRGGAARGFQAGRLRLSVGGKADAATDATEGLADGAANVAAVYATLRDDIAKGTRAVTGFAHAVRLARLVDAAMVSSREGRRVQAADWPEE